jgi:HEAT repeat protein
MISEPQTRQFLIDTCHASLEAEDRILRELQTQEFVALLVRIAVDEDDFEGDAPMQAAYYLSKAHTSLMQPHEAALLALLETADGYAGSVALALGHMKSEQAKPVIEQRLKDGWWPEHFYKEALSYYDNA